MLKKTMIAGAGIAACVLLAVGFMLINNIRFMPMKIMNNAGEGAVDADKARRLNEIYDINFIADRMSINTAKILIPKYEMTAAETAEEYAGLFGFTSERREFENYFLYEKGDEKLYIDRYSAYLWYENPQAAMKEEAVGEDEIIEKAIRLVSEKFPALAYEKTVIQPEEGEYAVQFIDRLNGYENYAFPLILIYNTDGVLTAIDYYFLDYETIAAVHLKPMKRAFYELPEDFPEGTRIDLKTCTAVYIYEESILQPAFLFEGAFAEGAPFRYFIRAAAYEKDAA